MNPRFPCNCMYGELRFFLEGKIINVSVHRPQGPVFQMLKAQTPFPIQHGDVVTISYDSLKRRKIPIDPIIVRKRDDLYWGDIKQAAPISILFSAFLVKYF